MNSIINVYYDYFYNRFICPDINYYCTKENLDIFGILKQRGYPVCKVIYNDREELKIL